MRSDRLSAPLGTQPSHESGVGPRIARGPGLFCVMTALVLGTSAAVGGVPSAAAQPLPADDLFKPGEATSPVAAPSDTGFADDLGAIVDATESTSRDECEKTNTAVIVGAVVVDVAALILFFILFWLIARRGRSHPWIVFFGVLFVVAAAAAVVIGVQRSDPETLLRCKRTADLAGVLIFDGFADWQRGLLLGAGPVIVLGTLLKVIVALIRR